jgi:hypothetical protein
MTWDQWVALDYDPARDSSPPSWAHIGQSVTVRGVECRITDIHPAGTIDVEEIDGPHAWRVSGLPF